MPPALSDDLPTYVVHENAIGGVRSSNSSSMSATSGVLRSTYYVLRRVVAWALLLTGGALMSDPWYIYTEFLPQTHLRQRLLHAKFR